MQFPRKRFPFVYDVMEILIRDLEMAKIGYIRVSTDKQLIDRQVDSLKDCCDQVFVEYGVSAVS